MKVYIELSTVNRVLFLMVMHGPFILADEFTPSVNKDNAHQTVSTSSQEVAVCKVSRTVENNGFHSELTMAIEVVVKPVQLFGAWCDVLLQETIPPGMYVDLYQVAALQQFGGPCVWSPEGDIDVEKPEYTSPSHPLYVYSKLTPDSGALRSNVTLPVHLRYHRPAKEQEFAPVVMRKPDILLKCSDDSLLFGVGKTVVAPCDCSTGKTCSRAWKKMPCIYSDEADLTFQVPVGRQEHTTLVVIGTLFITVGATVFLIYVIIRKPIQEYTRTPPKQD